MSKVSYFKKVFEPGNEILSIKILSIKEIQNLSNNCKKKLDEDYYSNLFDYYADLIYILVKDGKKVIEKLNFIVDEQITAGTIDLKIKKNVMQTFIEDIGVMLCELYPTLEPVNLCTHINIVKLPGEFPLSPQQQKIKNKLSGNIDFGGKNILSKKDIEHIETTLKTNIIGQNKAIDTIIPYIKLFATGLTDKAAILFIGPTGCGKSLTGKELGELLFEGRHYKINCGEFSQPHEYAKLIGAPPGYIGSDSPAILKEKADISNQWVFEFDEIEKANTKFYDFLLALFDTGVVYSSKGEKLDFSNSIFIMTSNLGIQDLNVGSKKVGFGESEITYEGSHVELRKSLEGHFRPEFLGRIDEVVYFKSLTKDELREVAKLELKNVPVIKTKALIDYIIEKGTSAKYGARFLSKFITKNIKTLVAEKILDNEVPFKGKSYSIKIKNNLPEITNTKVI